MDNKKVQDTFDYKTAELAGLPVKYFEKNRENFFSNLSKRIPNLNLNSVIVLKGGDEIPRYDTDINHYHFCVFSTVE